MSILVKVEINKNSLAVQVVHNGFLDLSIRHWPRSSFLPVVVSTATRLKRLVLSGNSTSVVALLKCTGIVHWNVQKHFEEKIILIIYINPFRVLLCCGSRACEPLCAGGLCISEGSWHCPWNYQTGKICPSTLSSITDVKQNYFHAVLFTYDCVAGQTFESKVCGPYVVTLINWHEYLSGK